MNEPAKEAIGLLSIIVIAIIFIGAALLVPSFINLGEVSDGELDIDEDNFDNIADSADDLTESLGTVLNFGGIISMVAPALILVFPILLFLFIIRPFEKNT